MWWTRLRHLVLGCHERWVNFEEVDRYISRVILQCRICQKVTTVVHDEREFVGRHRDYL